MKKLLSLVLAILMIAGAATVLSSCGKKGKGVKVIDIELTEEEEFAILYHNGLYSELKYSYSGKETPLSMVLHFADLWASRVTEKGAEE